MSKITSKISLEWLKRRSLSVSALMLGILVPTVLSGIPSTAYHIGGGRTVFDKAPRLVDYGASRTDPGAYSSYQFTIEIPEDAGEALQAVKIVQKPNLEQIAFDSDKTDAFQGDLFATNAPSLSLTSLGGEEPTNGNEVLVVFDRPVQPGNTVTVSLKAKKNPKDGGIYMFGVTAFSEGYNSPGLYIGAGRIAFHSD